MVAGSAFASNKVQDDANIEAHGPTIKTRAELGEYTTHLLNLPNSKNYDTALKILLRSPVIELKPIFPEDMAILSFAKYSSLGLISLKTGDQASLNPTIAIRSYKDAINYFDTYLNSYKDYVSSHSGANEMIQDQIYNASFSCHLAYLNWALLLDLNTQSAQRKGLLLSSVYHLQTAIKSKKNEKFESTGADLLNLDHQLFNLYNYLITCAPPQEKQTFLDQAKGIYSKYKSDKTAVTQAQIMKHVLEEYEALWAIPSEGSRNTTSTRVQELKSKKKAALNHARDELFDSIIGEIPYDPRPLQTKIREQHEKLCSLATHDLGRSQVVESLKEIEKQIKFELDANALPSSLSNVYEQYEVFLEGEVLRKQIMSIILPAFLSLGQNKEALERVNILAELEVRKIGNNSTLTRFVRAAIKNSNDDYKEWEELEKEMALKQQQEKEKKKRKQQKQHALDLEKIKKQQEEATQQAEQRDVSAQPQPSSGQKKPILIPIAEEEQRAFELNPNAKQEKIKRHTDAVIARTTAPVSTSEQVSIVQSNTTPPQVMQSVTVPLIREHYILKRLAKGVDEEIESKTWRITRQELIDYFSELGCTPKNGGKHAKVSLPEALIIEHEGKILTIINDLGGALTLPRWDGAEGNGTVPKYLRSQILAAREKLVLFKIKQKKK